MVLYLLIYAHFMQMIDVGYVATYQIWCLQFDSTLMGLIDQLIDTFFFISKNDMISAIDSLVKTTWSLDSIRKLWGDAAGSCCQLPVCIRWWQLHRKCYEQLCFVLGWLIGRLVTARNSWVIQSNAILNIGSCDGTLHILWIIEKITDGIWRWMIWINIKCNGWSNRSIGHLGKWRGHRGHGVAVGVIGRVSHRRKTDNSTWTTSVTWSTTAPLCEQSNWPLDRLSAEVSWLTGIFLCYWSCQYQRIVKNLVENSNTLVKWISWLNEWWKRQLLTSNLQSNVPRLRAIIEIATNVEMILRNESNKRLSNDS